MTNTLIIIASICLGEGGIDGPAGIHAVAEVIRNRSAYRHQTPYQVVTSRGAFASWSPKLPYRMQHAPGWPYAVALAGMILEAPHLIPDTINGADHFDNIRLKGAPYWSRGHKPVAHVGRQTFWKLSKQSLDTRYRVQQTRKQA